MILRFLRSNIGNILWFIVYFLISWQILGGTPDAFGIALLMYTISVVIALSFIGEAILRFSVGARPAQTKQDKEYLIPLFEEVYQSAQEKCPKLSKCIKIYITDSMMVNAFATGRDTIVVTRGALSTFSREQLKGVLAHEFGHLANGDTKALLLNLVGNGFFTLGLIALKIVMFIVNFFIAMFDESGVFSIVMLLVTFVINVYVFLFTTLGRLLLSADSRNAEKFADYFAYEIEYSEGLIEALYLLQKTNFSGKVSIMERLTASHPHTTDRIARLEGLLEKE